MPANRGRRAINRLIDRDGIRCHYCNVICVYSQGCNSNAPNSATREHVVPRSKGGANEMHNMVLACRRCNNTRGDGEPICRCAFCRRAYELTWHDQFKVIWEFNYNRVWKSRNGRWLCRYKGNVRSFKTWDGAMHYLNNKLAMQRIKEHKEEMNRRLL